MRWKANENVKKRLLDIKGLYFKLHPGRKIAEGKDKINSYKNMVPY